MMWFHMLYMHVWYHTFENKMINYSKELPWIVATKAKDWSYWFKLQVTLELGTKDDLTPGLLGQQGFEPMTHALEVQCYNHYAMVRPNSNLNCLCIRYQSSWLVRLENWKHWLEIACHLFNNHTAIQQEC